MARKHRYTAKEHRQVEHVKESEEARGVSPDEAEGIGYATVNKLHPERHRYTAKEQRQAEHIIERRAREVERGSEAHRLRNGEQAQRVGAPDIGKEPGDFSPGS